MNIHEWLDEVRCQGVPDDPGECHAAAVSLWRMLHKDAAPETIVLIRQIEAAAERRYGADWYDDYMRERLYCDRCGERYRRENLMPCFGCFDELCYRCEGAHKRSCAGLQRQSQSEARGPSPF